MSRTLTEEMITRGMPGILAVITRSSQIDVTDKDINLAKQQYEKALRNYYAFYTANQGDLQDEKQVLYGLNFARVQFEYYTDKVEEDKKTIDELEKIQEKERKTDPNGWRYREAKGKLDAAKQNYSLHLQQLTLKKELYEEQTTIYSQYGYKDKAKESERLLGEIQRTYRIINILREAQVKKALKDKDDPDKAVRIIKETIAEYVYGKEEARRGRYVLYSDLVNDKKIVLQALLNGNIPFIKELIPVIPTQSNTYLLKIALNMKDQDLAIFTLKYGANPNEFISAGEGIKIPENSQCMYEEFREDVSEPDSQIGKLADIEQYRCNPNVAEIDILTYCLQNKLFIVAKELIQRGAVLYADHLTYAISNDSPIDVIECLIQGGVQILDKHLELAIEMKHQDAVLRFLDTKVSHIRYISIAIKNEFSEAVIMKLLSKYNVSEGGLFAAIEQGFPQNVLIKLIEKYSGINVWHLEAAIERDMGMVADKICQSLLSKDSLSLAIENELYKACKKMLEYLEPSPEHLKLAIEQDFLGGVSLILEKLPKEQITKEHLLCAIKNYSPEIVLEVIKRGAEVTEEHKRCAKKLLEEGPKFEPSEKEYFEKKMQNIICILEDPKQYLDKKLEIDDYIMKSSPKRMRAGSPVRVVPDRIRSASPKGMLSENKTKTEELVSHGMVKPEGYMYEF